LGLFKTKERRVGACRLNALLAGWLGTVTTKLDGMDSDPVEDRPVKCLSDEFQFSILIHNRTFIDVSLALKTTQRIIILVVIFYNKFTVKTRCSI
jgi:hypothetical protein